jgi:hypothetical protein
MELFYVSTEELKENKEMVTCIYISLFKGKITVIFHNFTNMEGTKDLSKVKKK